MERFSSRKKYDEIKYFGDGHNDLHAAMALSENDIILPRKDFRLDDLVSNGENEIKANVHPWQDGSDILQILQLKDIIQKKLEKLNITIARIEILFAQSATKLNIFSKLKLNVHSNNFFQHTEGEFVE